MNLHDSIGHLVHRTDVKLTNYFIKQLKHYELTPEQWGIMSILDNERGTTQKELAATIDKDQTTVVRMIHSLEKKGIVKKTFNDEDKRSHYLLLTNKGEGLKETLLPIVKDAHNFIIRGLSTEEIQQLKSLLNKLYENATDK
ncbi:MarR family transcriptional regulator [Bacillus toyonensis]|uniref:MarR family winged helix-turn-helix transcriptional regulator n=1 Tax=Bacillus toyonensis TaxID=155322 RepID=UPI000BF5F7B2|nr:MarR family transcriptional regulator [Bacillus toyonensis]PGB40552.1 MarR family transcriptional regulator [Bacillus toyonensis]